MFQFILKAIIETVTILADLSIYLLFGFFIAGLIHVYLLQGKIKKFFGRRSMRSVFNASLFGIPLPLCSCSVLPAAVELRKSGASKGSIFSFLISTPETSIPSIGISLALLDPLMTFFRPLAALITALLAGWGVNIADRNSENTGVYSPDDINRSCHRGNESKEEGEGSEGGNHVAKIREAAVYAFTDLLDDLAPWLVLGLIAAGVISVIVPDSLFTGFLGGGIWPMLLMLIIGMPLYVCAESSTPIAAALILKGLSPGAAFVFLLAGPATNISSLVVLSKYFSRKILVIYLAAIAVMAFLLGAILNGLYSFFDLNVSATVGTASGIFPTWIKVAATLTLIGLLHCSFSKMDQYRKWWQWTKGRIGWSAKAVARAMVIIFAILYVTDGLFVVPAGNIGMVMSFGKVIGSNLQPGLHYRPPTPFGKTVLVKTDLVRCIEIGFRKIAEGETAKPAISSASSSTMYEKLDNLPQSDVPEESELLAGDENLLEIDLTVHYSITDAYQTTYRLENVQQILRELTSYQILREITTRQVSDELTAERVDFELGVKRGLQASLEELGIGVEIRGVYVVYGHAPGVVHPAYRDVASAMEDKYRSINLAQTDSVSALAKARGKRVQRMTNALTDSLTKVNTAMGQSSRFQSLAQATKQYRLSQQFRMNAETAESTLIGPQKILSLTEDPGLLDLIVLPESAGVPENLPPEILKRLGNQ